MEEEMSGYTKAPWILDGVEIRASDSHPIDRICDMAPGFSEADAKLIAAAPDLLEALIAMNAQLEAEGYMGTTYGPLRLAATKAIAKALA
jgi:hypothetical protein